MAGTAGLLSLIDLTIWIICPDAPPPPGEKKKLVSFGEYLHDSNYPRVGPPVCTLSLDIVLLLCGIIRTDFFLPFPPPRPLKLLYLKTI